MKGKTIRNILETYLANAVPSQVRDAFSRWFVAREDFSEKDDALSDIWDQMALSKDEYQAPDSLADAATLLKRAEALEKPQLKLRRQRIFAYALSSVAACLSFAAILLWTVGGGTQSIYVSPADAKVEFTLPDGTRVWLNHSSSLSYKGKLDGRRRMVNLQGEAFFDVAKDEKHPFIVQTSSMDVTVLGTRFTMSAYGDKECAVYLESGRVCVSSPAFGEEFMLPGECVSYNPMTGKMSHHQETAFHHTSWINDRLEFRNSSLKDIVTSLEHWYNVEIEFDGKLNSDDVHLSMTVHNEPIGEILDAMARIARVKISSKGSMYTISME